MRLSRGPARTWAPGRWKTSSRESHTASHADGSLRVCRLCRAAHSRLDGEGARLAGGRWNRRGTADVYTSATLSLAALELLVHVSRQTSPEDLVASAAAIPDDLGRFVVDARDLPPGWRAYPAS